MAINTKEAKKNAKIWNWTTFILGVISLVLIVTINKMKL